MFESTTHQHTPIIGERRKSGRCPVNWETILLLTEQAAEGRLVDLSMKGCCLTTREPVRRGDRVKLIVLYSEEDRPLHVSMATVRWVSAPYAGIVFDALSDHVKRDVERALGKTGKRIGYEPIGETVEARKYKSMGD